MEIAARLNRCVTIHCLGAWDKILQYLKRNEKELPPCIIFHSYNGGVEFMERLLDLCDAYFSYSPLVFEEGYKKIKESAVATPLDRILIESDGEKIEEVIFF